jgi:hypothetical protein
MNDAFQAISDALTNLGGWTRASQAVLALTLAGMVSTAVIQLFKDLTAIRRWFQEGWLGSWLEQRTAAFNLSLGKEPLPPLATVSLDKVKAQLIELATGGDHNAFYDLPSDRLVAQANAAAQSALDYPGVAHYYPLLAVLSQGAALKDLQPLVAHGSLRLAAADKQLSAEDIDARTRVAHRLQRNLDGMQISLGDKWQFFLQSASFVSSTIVIEAAVYVSQRGVAAEKYSYGAYALAVGVGLVASYLSPVINDLIKGLQSLKK